MHHHRCIPQDEYKYSPYCDDKEQVLSREDLSPSLLLLIPKKGHHTPEMQNGLSPGDPEIVCVTRREVLVGAELPCDDPPPTLCISYDLRGLLHPSVARDSNDSSWPSDRVNVLARGV